MRLQRADDQIEVLACSGRWLGEVAQDQSHDDIGECRGELRVHLVEVRCRSISNLFGIDGEQGKEVACATRDDDAEQWMVLPEQEYAFGRESHRDVRVATFGERIIHDSEEGTKFVLHHDSCQIRPIANFVVHRLATHPSTLGDSFHRDLGPSVRDGQVDRGLNNARACIGNRHYT